MQYCLLTYTLLLTYAILFINLYNIVLSTYTILFYQLIQYCLLTYTLLLTYAILFINLYTIINLCNIVY
jgi:hypothetical protein